MIPCIATKTTFITDINISLKNHPCFEFKIKIKIKILVSNLEGLSTGDTGRHTNINCTIPISQPRSELFELFKVFVTSFKGFPNLFKNDI